MNPVERLIRRVDRWQRRHFPLLLVLTTILGIVAADNPALRHSVLTAVAGQFPVISHELSRNVYQLRQASYIGLVVGLLVPLWGSSGLAQSGMFAMAQVCNLPGPDRPGYWQRLGRAGLFLLVLGVGVAVTTLLTSFGTFGSSSVLLTIAAELLAAAVNMGIYTVGFRVLTPRTVPIRKLVAWIYLVVEITIYAAEVNVVLARRLWPRSIVQPPLTPADRQALELLPLAEQRREEQQVAVSFGGPRETGARSTGETDAAS